MTDALVLAALAVAMAAVCWALDKRDAARGVEARAADAVGRNNKIAAWSKLRRQAYKQRILGSRIDAASYARLYADERALRQHAERAVLHATWLIEKQNVELLRLKKLEVRILFPRASGWGVNKRGDC
jgi:hypothetical protein